MSAATVTIQSTASVSTPFGSIAIGPITVTGAVPPSAQQANLASGNNTFTVPASSAGCVIAPPTTNNVVIKAKTTSGDTGLLVPQAAPSVLIFDPANVPGTLYLNAASNTTGLTAVIFF